jgi:hypothetical protein
VKGNDYRSAFIQSSLAAPVYTHSLSITDPNSLTLTAAVRPCKTPCPDNYIDPVVEVLIRTGFTTWLPSPRAALSLNISTMGSASSKPAPQAITEKVVSPPSRQTDNERVAELLARINLRSEPSAAVEPDAIKAWEHAFQKDPQKKFAQTVLS